MDRSTAWKMAAMQSCGAPLRWQSPVASRPAGARHDAVSRMYKDSSGIWGILRAILCIVVVSSGVVVDLKGIIGTLSWTWADLFRIYRVTVKDFSGVSKDNCYIFKGCRLIVRIRGASENILLYCAE